MQSDDRAAVIAPPRGTWPVKLGLLLILVSTAVVAWYFLDREQLLRLGRLIRDAREQHPVLTYGGAFALYVVVTGLSLPAATFLSLAYASLLGFWRAVLLVSFASTMGATAAFLTSRYLLRDLVRQIVGPRLAAMDEAVRREGAYYLFTLRLIPVVPFFAVNLGMGLTPLRVRTFWWVSQLGMLPATCAYCWAGSRLDLERIADEGLSGLVSWDVLLAFAILGLLPLATKKLVNRWKRDAPQRPSP
jgi:uncharacterized membrane protein YdjX (TVP38/TMEM64 family)